MANSISSNNLLQVIVAIFIPPLAVALQEGLSKRFWISLVLTVLFFIPGMIYSLYVVLN